MEDGINISDSKIPIGTNETNQVIEELRDAQEQDNKNQMHKEGLTRTKIVEKKVENYSLDDLGDIEIAKLHRSANRPLHKINELTDYVTFCRCCSLPCEEKGILEPFHYCDDIDKFSECGLGVTLYFYYFKFMSFIVFMGICILAISMMVFNLNYTDGINDVCNDFYKDIKLTNETNLGHCKGFVKDSEEDTNYYNRFNRWILRFSSDNLLVYRKLPEQLKGSYEDNIEDVLINYSILIFCYLLTSFIINIFFIIFIKAQVQKYNLLSLSIRDYTVLVSDAKRILLDYLDRKHEANPILFRKSNITVENGKEFIAFVNDYIRAEKDLFDLRINSINMCYDLGNYIECRDEYERCKKKIFQVKYNKHNIDLNDERIKKIKQEGKPEGPLYDEGPIYYNFPLKFFEMYCCYKEGPPLITLLKQKDDLYKQLELEQQEIIQYITEDNFTGYMFVSFNKIKDKEIILAQYPHNFFDMILYFLRNIKYYLFCCCISKDDRIRFRRAKGIDVYDPPEPEDVIWENFRYTARERGIRTLVVFLVCLLIMALSFAIVFGLTFAQDYLYDDERGTKSTNIFLKYLISLAITIVINIINTCIKLVLEKLTYLEKQISTSNYILSLSIKITIFTFLNSAIVPLLSKHIVRLINESDADKNNPYYKRNRERNNLLIDDMLVYFIVNAIFTPLLWTLNFTLIYKFLRIKCCIERGSDPNNNHYLNQWELNKLYEYPDMDLAYKYSYLAKTTAMALFYMPIFPLGFIFAFIGFVFGYLLELFNFTHIYKRPEMLNEIITQVYSDYFIVILFIGGIGDYFFLHDIYPSPDNRWSLTNIILFGVLIIVPYTKFINCNFVGTEKSEFYNYPLSEVYFTFYNDYQRQNPLTKKIGLINYLNELKKNGYLSDNAFKIAEDNIDKLNYMEAYYNLRNNRISNNQSALVNNIKGSAFSTSVSKSLLGKGLLKNTVIKPELLDNNEEKERKRRLFDTQIYNMVQSIDKNAKNMSSISEANEDLEKEKLNELFQENLGNVPLSTSVVKNSQINNNLKSSVN